MNTLNPNQRIKSSELNQNFNDLSTGVGDTIGNSLVTHRTDSHYNFIVSGLIVSAATGLNINISAGVVVINGIRYDIPAKTNYTLPASKDNYLDIDGAGIITNVSNTIGVYPANLTANKIRFAIVVTNATVPTAIRQYGESYDTNAPVYPKKVGSVTLVNDYWKCIELGGTRKYFKWADLGVRNSVGAGATFFATSTQNLPFGMRMGQIVFNATIRSDSSAGELKWGLESGTTMTTWGIVFKNISAGTVSFGSTGAYLEILPYDYT